MNELMVHAPEIGLSNQRGAIARPDSLKSSALVERLGSNEDTASKQNVWHFEYENFMCNSSLKIIYMLKEISS